MWIEPKSSFLGLAAPVPDTGGWPTVCAFQLGNDADIGLGQAMSMLSAPEKARAARFKFQRDHDRFVRGRGMLRKTLAHRLGVAPDAVALVTTGNGKPVLADGSLHFNLSHSGDLAVIALSGKGPVGVDVEVTSRAVQPMDLAETCFTEHEMNALRRADQPEQHFYAYWTAKEAFMKLTGEGMSLAPSQIVLTLDGDGWPIGYAPRDGVAANLRYVDLGFADATCCLATTMTLSGSQPS